MSVKKEPSGRRSVQVEVEVPCTPEEVWRAIATGPGVSAWFVPTEIVEEAGKPVAVKCNFGPGMESVARVTEWDPPRKFAAESPWAPDAPPVATEWIVEARSGSTCVVRVVHSLFASTDEWDSQLEGTESGWPAAFRILRLYLAHFRGLPSSLIQMMVPTSGTVDDAWKSLTGTLGLTGAKAGQRWQAPAGTPRLAGTVELVGPAERLLLRLETPGPGVAAFGAIDCGGPVMVSLSFYLYGDAAASLAATEEPAWQAWVKDKFAAA